MGYIPQRSTSSSLSAAKKTWISGFKNNYEAYGVWCSDFFSIKHSPKPATTYKPGDTPPLQMSLSASVIL